MILSVIAVVLGIYFIQNYVNKSFKENLVSDTPAQDLNVTEAPENKENKSAFAIFTNGTFRPFTALMYHNLSPYAYITAENPNVVIIEKEGIMWKDFFNSLPFELTKDCLTTGTRQTFCTGKSGVLKFYLNGGRDDDLLVRTINDGDKALVTFGPEEEPNLEFQLSQIPDPV